MTEAYEVEMSCNQVVFDFATYLRKVNLSLSNNVAMPLLDGIMAISIQISQATSIAH